MLLYIVYIQNGIQKTKWKKNRLDVIYIFCIKYFNWMSNPQDLGKDKIWGHYFSNSQKQPP